MTQHTLRLNLPYPDDDGEESPNGPAELKALAMALDGAMIYKGQGNLADRPAYGLAGAVWVSTDQDPKLLSVDLGTAWLDLAWDQIMDNADMGDDSVDERVLAPLSVGTAEIIASAVTAAKIADGTITAAKLSAAIKPSGGAGGADEALRSLGTSAASATAGNDSRIPTQAENDALVGTYGASSGTNKFVTASDPHFGSYDRKVNQIWIPASDAGLKTMYTKTIKGGDLGVAGQVMLSIQGQINSLGTTHPALTFSMEFGGTVIFASMWTAMNGSAGGTANFTMAIYLMNIDATHQIAFFKNDASGFGNNDGKNGRATGINIDTTADKDLVLKGQFAGGANASNSLLIDQLIMQIR